MIYETNKFYRNFEIEKRNGNKRLISAPYPSLKLVQEWIHLNILSKKRCHFAVFSYKPGKNIIDNAKLHLGSSEILKIDIKDFFPSITYKTVFYLFYKLGYTKKVSFYLAKLCTLNNSLPQGAPTSPYISNLIFFDIDKELFHLAKKHNLKYSRYADDLCFSGEIDSRLKLIILNKVKRRLYKRGYKINITKTAIRHKNQRQSLTGIVINEKLSVKREYERKIRQELYFINKFGLESHREKINEKRIHYKEHLIGKINYLCTLSQRERYLNYKKQSQEIFGNDINP